MSNKMKLIKAYFEVITGDNYSYKRTLSFLGDLPDNDEVVKAFHNRGAIPAKYFEGIDFVEYYKTFNSVTHRKGRDTCIKVCFNIEEVDVYVNE